MQGLEVDVALRRDGFELDIRESFASERTTAIFGANGSGKTTLLRIIAGLEPESTGTVRYRDHDWQKAGKLIRPEEREVGYVFQEGRLFPHLDVRRNLEFSGRFGRRYGDVDFDSTVGALDLGPLLERYPATLSGGERQRVAIGRALLTGASLLLMDEPLSALDQARRRELMPLIKRIPEEYRTTIVYVTHDLDELVYLADSVVLLAEGRSIAHASAREILARSDFTELTALEQPPVVLETRIDSHDGQLTSVAIADARLRIPRVAGEPGEPVRLRVEPRDVILAVERPHGISIRNCLATTITSLDASDELEVIVGMSVGGQPLRAKITHAAARELGLAEGQPVYALIKTLALESPG